MYRINSYSFAVGLVAIIAFAVLSCDGFDERKVNGSSHEYEYFVPRSVSLELVEKENFPQACNGYIPYIPKFDKRLEIFNRTWKLLREAPLHIRMIIGFGVDKIHVANVRCFEMFKDSEVRFLTGTTKEHEIYLYLDSFFKLPCTASQVLGGGCDDERNSEFTPVTAEVFLLTGLHEICHTLDIYNSNRSHPQWYKDLVNDPWEVVKKAERKQISHSPLWDEEWAERCGLTMLSMYFRGDEGLEDSLNRLVTYRNFSQYPLSRAFFQHILSEIINRHPATTVINFPFSHFDKNSTGGLGELEIKYKLLYEEVVMLRTQNGSLKMCEESLKQRMTEFPSRREIPAG